MASHCAKVGTFLLLLLSLFALSSSEVDLEILLARQEEQINKLQGLVDTLSRSVSMLESSLTDTSCSRLDPPESSSPPPIMEVVDSQPLDLTSAAGSGVAEVVRRQRAVGGVTVTKYRPSWLDRFQFLAAARLEAEATCAAVLPYEDNEGFSKYFAAGDANGKVYIFSSAGDILIDSFAPTGSPVTAILSYLSAWKNESLLFTGHGDGSIVAHRVWESAANGDDWPSLSVGTSKLFVRGGESGSSQIVQLEVHQIGQVRYVIASDEGGRIRVFTENGMLYGTVLASSRPLAFMKQRMLFLTESTAGWLDLRRMAVRESKCEGLNGSIAKSYALHVSERSKAFGFTSTGDIIHVVLLGDTSNLKCRVRAVRKSDIDVPVSIHAIKGYLLVVNQEKVFLYNVSSQYSGRVGVPRYLFSVSLHEIKSLFLNFHASDDGPAVGKPLVAGGREKLVVLGLGDGYIGIYQSNFPVFKVQNNAVVWSSPVLVFLMLLIGIWHFYVKKRESLGWIPPEEAFTAPAGASSGILGPAAGGDRAFTDSSRAAETRDTRGSVLRGPSRRYASPPSRYPGGPAVPFRPSSADPSLRGGADLKYRGPGIEPPGFPKRREPIFTNSQDLDDHVD